MKKSKSQIPNSQQISIAKIPNSKHARNFESQTSNLFRVSPARRSSSAGGGFACPPKPGRRRWFQVYRPGFTLVEIIVYVAILTVVSVAAVDTFIMIHSSLSEIRAVRSLNGASSVAMERMTRIIRDAKSVDTAGSLFDVSPGILIVTDAAVAHRFSVSSNRLKYQRGAEQEIDLTGPGTLVDGLVFRLINAGTTSQAVKIELTLAASSGKATTTQNFYNTVVLRNSYSQ